MFVRPWPHDQFRRRLDATGELSAIRRCRGCARLFYDGSRSGRKKWCSMASCANSQKTKRYFRKRCAADPA
ncbi:CGNR zinc finger domain-containing protein [Mucilaginibacter pedocola]|uniref:CGNR zinc finger domain-containing protein n=1 Tax=Mucilaginibacter pedocola TaxID=1792845 RepID=UPI0009937175